MLQQISAWKQSQINFNKSAIRINNVIYNLKLFFIKRFIEEWTEIVMNPLLFAMLMIATVTVVNLVWIFRHKLMRKSKRKGIE
ncbi:hypothetical protein COL87_00890 [Bacillus pseudomycoides]|nr:hypothetical protein COL87_00890 [Bacillus pseudomycoides]PGC41240.1 hypothetical protein COM18_11990 [Bacillus pseudomycoides]PHE92417.1 hypothetical protein COF78_17665 [Bacillus pseudomycoides]